MPVDFWHSFSSRKVWFKNKRAKCRQIQKQNTGKTAETAAPAASAVKKTTNAAPTKLKVKSASAILNSSATSSLLAETSNFIKAQNSFLIPSGSTKVRSRLADLNVRHQIKTWHLFWWKCLDEARISKFCAFQLSTPQTFDFKRYRDLIQYRTFTHSTILFQLRFTRRNRHHHWTTPDWIYRTIRFGLPHTSTSIRKSLSVTTGINHCRPHSKHKNTQRHITRRRIITDIRAFATPTSIISTEATSRWS